MTRVIAIFRRTHNSVYRSESSTRIGPFRTFKWLKGVRANVNLGRVYKAPDKMPEVQVSPTADAERKFSILSNGLGDSDMFPLLESSSDEEAFVHPEEEKWGFRITGGAEFKMPVVVFQVSDDSLAAKNGIRLGDIILKINGIDTSSLTLSEARKVVQQAGDSLELIARKMEDENETTVEEKTVLLKQPIEFPNIEPPRAVIQERLALLQRKLAEIAEIPMLLQSTLETVSKTVETLVPPDTEDHFSEPYDDCDYYYNGFATNDVYEDYATEDTCEFSDDSDTYEEYIFEDSLEPAETPRDEQEEEESLEQIPELEEDCKEPTPEPTEEDLLQQEKKQKIQELEKSWPWEDRKKVIHKFSDRRIVPTKSIVRERITQFSGSNLMGRNIKMD